jgi:hypothetical protein
VSSTQISLFLAQGCIVLVCCVLHRRLLAPSEIDFAVFLDAVLIRQAAGSTCEWEYRREKTPVQPAAKELEWFCRTYHGSLRATKIITLEFPPPAGDSASRAFFFRLPACCCQSALQVRRFINLLVQDVTLILPFCPFLPLSNMFRYCLASLLLLPSLFSCTLATDNSFVYPPPSGMLYVPPGTPLTIEWTTDYASINLRVFQENDDGSFNFNTILCKSALRRLFRLNMG